MELSVIRLVVSDYTLLGSGINNSYRLKILEKCDIESVIGISYCSEFSYSYS